MARKTIVQVELFNTIPGDPKKECNDFLLTLSDENIRSVESHYDATLGGVVYVVVFTTVQIV